MAHNVHPERLLKMIERMQIGSFFCGFDAQASAPTVIRILIRNGEKIPLRMLRKYGFCAYLSDFAEQMQSIQRFPSSAPYSKKPHKYADFFMRDTILIR